MEPGGLPSVGVAESDSTELLNTHTIQRVLLLKNSSLFYSYENFECKTNLNASI